MNCDQVFSALTRGPFPTGNDALDERVERHLETCGSCRRLAAALQPAVELFEESISPDESCGLPAYWGDLFQQGDAPRATRTGVLSLRRLMRSSSPVGRATGWRWEHAWRVAAALLLGMALGGVLRAALQDSDGSAAKLADHRARSRTSADQSRNLRLAAFNGLRMTKACGPLAMAIGPNRAPTADVASFSAPPTNSGFPSVSAGETAGEPSAADWNKAAIQKCCTECHHAGDGGAPLAQSARVHVANSCALCHDSSTTTLLTIPVGGE